MCCASYIHSMRSVRAHCGARHQSIVTSMQPLLGIIIWHMSIHKCSMQKCSMQKLQLAIAPLSVPRMSFFMCMSLGHYFGSLELIDRTNSMRFQWSRMHVCSNLLMSVTDTPSWSFKLHKTLTMLHVLRMDSYKLTAGVILCSSDTRR